MNARRQMTQRCTVWRNLLGAPDPYGHQEETPEVLHPDLPCKVWNAISQVTGEVTAADRDYVLKEYRMLVPLNTDVGEDDYVEGVTDQRGNVKYSTHMDIKEVIPRPDHLLLMLQEVT